MDLLFLGLTFTATIALLMLNFVLTHLAKINKIKKDIDSDISPDKLADILASLDK